MTVADSKEIAELLYDAETSMIWVNSRYRKQYLHICTEYGY